MRDERIINHKLAEAMKLALNIRWEGLRKTKKGAAADLIISMGDVAVKYNVYLRNTIVLDFHSANQKHVELATFLLRLVGVDVEVRKENVGWRVRAYIDKLAAGREELRKALAEIVRKAAEGKMIDAGKAERWLEKLEEGRMEGWPEYYVGLSNGALVVKFISTNPDNIERETQRLEKMGLKRGVHFSVKMPEGGEEGYVRIHKAGLMYLARLSVRGKDEKQRELAAALVEYILKRAEKAGNDVHEKALKIIKEGMLRGSQTLRDLEKWVEVNGKTYVVKVKGGEAVEEGEGNRKLLRIKITAEGGRVEGGHIVDRVEREYTITYSRDNKNAAMAYAYGEIDDVERLAAVIKALTEKEPRMYQKSSSKIELRCYEGHLEGFMRYEELVDVIESWLEETSR